MNAERAARPAPAPDRDLTGTMIRWGIVIVVGIAVAMFLSALLPRWWAQQVGNLIDGRISYGSVLGVGFGIICTFVPLLLALWSWKQRARKPLALTFLGLGLLLALPNLMTLWVVLGNGSAAHAGERILDVDGPGFRGGTLVGAVLGAVIFGFVAYQSWQAARAKRERIARERRFETDTARTAPGDG